MDAGLATHARPQQPRIAGKWHNRLVTDARQLLPTLFIGHGDQWSLDPVGESLGREFQAYAWTLRRCAQQSS